MFSLSEAQPNGHSAANAKRENRCCTIEIRRSPIASEPLGTGNSNQRLQSERLGSRRRNCFGPARGAHSRNEREASDTLCAVPRQIADDFAAAHRMADERHVAKAEHVENSVESSASVSRSYPDPGSLKRRGRADRRQCGSDPRPTDESSGTTQVHVHRPPVNEENRFAGCPLAPERRRSIAGFDDGHAPAVSGAVVPTRPPIRACRHARPPSPI